MQILQSTQKVKSRESKSEADENPQKQIAVSDTDRCDFWELLSNFKKNQGKVILTGSAELQGNWLYRVTTKNVIKQFFSISLSH